MKPTSIQYRPDIDGLRALSVMSVVVFHGGFGFLSGGFIGVDVFFVISGYLITTILLKDYDDQTFSIVNFYERRIRRILPALLLVIFASSIGAAFILAPLDFSIFSKSANATLLFLSNFFFSSQAGYFMPAANTMPLLHTWSLGVEEQFYGVAPFAILLIRKYVWDRRALIISALFLISLSLSVYGVQNEMPWAFYLPHSRAFELMCGVSLALGVIPHFKTQFARQALSLLGLSLILIALLFLRAESPFPGFAALLPSIGALLILKTGRLGDTTISKLLSLTPLTFIGKISYPLYLWHWPLLSFFEYRFGEALTSWHRLGLIGLAAILSIITYYFVEKPVQNNRRLFPRKTIFTAGVLITAIFLVFGEFVIRSEGLPSRLSPEAASVALEISKEFKQGHSCGVDESNDPKSCFPETADAKNISFVLWGDSHAGVIAPMILDLAATQGLKGKVMIGGGCMPAFGLEKLGWRFKKCALIAKSVRALLEDQTITHVILAARWALYAEGEASLNEMNITPKKFSTISKADNQRLFAEMLNEDVKAIRAAGKKVTIIGPTPELEMDLHSETIKAAMQGRTNTYVLERAKFDARQAFVLKTLKELETIEGVRIVYPHEQLCSQAQCMTKEGNALLYIDDDHLSPTGTVKISKSLSEIFK